MTAACRLAVRTVPNAPGDAVVGWMGDRLKVKVQAPALDGRANEALCGFLARELQVSKGSVSLLQGAKSRSKVVEIRGLALAEVRARLGV